MVELACTNFKNIKNDLIAKSEDLNNEKNIDDYPKGAVYGAAKGHKWVAWRTTYLYQYKLDGDTCPHCTIYPCPSPFK